MKQVGSFCCPVLPEPRLPNHLGSEGHFIIVGTYTSSPITAEQYRAKDQPLHVRRSCFAPAGRQKTEYRKRGSEIFDTCVLSSVLRWRRRVPPPGPVRLLRSRLSP